MVKLEKWEIVLIKACKQILQNEGEHELCCPCMLDKECDEFIKRHYGLIPKDYEVE